MASHSAPAEWAADVVLVNFWTLTCISWLAPGTVRAGLVTVLPRRRAGRDGVHAPEFSFEHEMDLVLLATKDRAIDYPVVVDNDYAIWNAFHNH